MKPSLFITIVLTALSALPVQAQLGRRELDDINRHRKPQQSVPVLSSVDGSDTLSRHAGASLIGTWDFLDEDEEREDHIRNNGKGPGDTLSLSLFINQLDIIDKLSLLPQETLPTYNERINDYILDYLERHRKRLPRILGKFQYYQPYFEAVFHRYGIPYEVAALAIVESAMSFTALSKAGAAGVWQLMPETAAASGMTCDPLVDERFDIHKATEAAGRYLSRMYRKFGSWTLAIASYNCGPGNVQSAIQKAGSEEFWDIYPFLPAETRNYLPAYTAALYTVEYYKDYGLTPDEYTEPRTMRFKLTSTLYFDEIEALSGADTKTIGRLNPIYTTGMVPATKTNPLILVLPLKNGKQFERKLSKK